MKHIRFLPMMGLLLLCFAVMGCEGDRPDAEPCPDCPDPAPSAGDTVEFTEEGDEMRITFTDPEAKVYVMGRCQELCSATAVRLADDENSYVVDKSQVIGLSIIEDQRNYGISLERPAWACDDCPVPPRPRPRFFDENIASVPTSVSESVGVYLSGDLFFAMPPFYRGQP